MEAPPRLISLGEPGGSDNASAVALTALGMGVPSKIVTSANGVPFETFDHGAIDWKKLMETAHWMVNCSSMVNLGKKSRNGMVCINDIRRARGLQECNGGGYSRGSRINLKDMGISNR